MPTHNGQLRRFLDDNLIVIVHYSQPVFSASSLNLSGVTVVGRQVAAPPLTSLRSLNVGAHRAISIPVTVKGCR